MIFAFLLVFALWRNQDLPSALSRSDHNVCLLNFSQYESSSLLTQLKGKLTIDKEKKRLDKLAAIARMIDADLADDETVKMIEFILENSADSKVTSFSHSLSQIS